MEEPPTAEVILTEKIKRWIRTALTTTDLPNETREQLRHYTTNRRQPDDKRAKTIPFQLVQAVHKCIQTEQGDLYLHELLEGSDVHLPEVPEVKRSPELEARIEKLKAEQANREYASMTRNVGNTSAAESIGASFGAEVKAVNRQLIVVFNTVLTVVGSFVFAYKATEYAMEKPSFETQLLSGLIVGTVVFFADLYFIIKNTL